MAGDGGCVLGSLGVEGVVMVLVVVVHRNKKNSLLSDLMAASSDLNNA